MLVGIVGFVADGSASQIVFALVVSLFFQVLHCSFLPLAHDKDDLVQTCTHLSIFFTLLGGLMIKVTWCMASRLIGCSFHEPPPCV